MPLAAMPQPASDQSSRTSNVRAMFNRIASRYDLLNRVVSLGLDRHWRRQTVKELSLAPGGLVLDLACGTSPLAANLQAAGLRTVGLDISEQMMLASPNQGRHILGDCLQLPVKNNSAQGVVCGFALRHFTDTRPLLAQAAQALAPYGRLALLELDIPRPWPLKLGHRLYCHSFIPLAGWLLAEKAAYRYLADSLKLLPEHAELERNLQAAGFADIRRFSLSAGIAQLVTATRQPAGS